MYIQKQDSIRPVLMWLFVCAVALTMLLAIGAAPAAAHTGHAEIGNTLYRAFGYVCHQLPERSYFLFNRPLAVCSRCTGLYVGFASAVFVYPLLRSLRETQTPERKWLFVAATPMALDVGLEFLGVWQNTHTSRLLTGLLLGAVAVLYVMPGLLEVSLWRSSSRPFPIEPRLG